MYRIMRNFLFIAGVMLVAVVLSVIFFGYDSIDQALFFTIVGAVLFTLGKGWFEGARKARQEKELAE